MHDFSSFVGVVDAASARILKRPWECNDAIKRIIDTIVQNRSSICQRIRNSEIFQAILGDHVSKDDMSKFSSNLSNLSHSKARYDSVVRALIRYIAMHKAVLATARDVATLRRGDEEGHDAEAFLHFVSGPEGAVRDLLAGLLCDAGSITMRLLRFFDCESFDVSQICRQIGEWCSAVQYFFIERRAFRSPGMFAHQALNNITSGIHTVILQGCRHPLGCQRTQARMRQWRALTPRSTRGS